MDYHATIRRNLRPHMIDDSQLARVMGVLEPLLVPPPPEPEPEPAPEFYTPGEVAARLRLSKMTVYRLCHSGDLPHVVLGRTYRIHAEPFEKLLQGQDTQVVRQPDREGGAS